MVVVRKFSIPKKVHQIGYEVCCLTCETVFRNRRGLSRHVHDKHRRPAELTCRESNVKLFSVEETYDMSIFAKATRGSYKKRKTVKAKKVTFRWKKK